MRSLLPRLRQPSRYTGIEQGAVHKDPSAVTVRAALCFPDLYEVGMSHLGQKIIYGIINRHPSWWAERCYEPDREDCDILRETGTRLATLESDTDLKDMNLVGFSITHELCYPDVLNMLDLGGIPLHTSERPQDLKACPLVIAGGGALLSAEPMAPFLDLMILGDGEETMVDLLNALEKALQEGTTRSDFLRTACAIPGIYVPSLYREGSDGRMEPLIPEAAHPTRRVVADFDSLFYPTNQVVPIATVHNRLSLEIARGCTRFCRFCHAGVVYRPARERSVETVTKLLKQCLDETGFDEISFLSLSAGDYSALRTLCSTTLDRCAEEQISLSLPSLRVGSIDDSIMDRMSSIRRTGMTLAPEAGSQRLRDVINKNVTWEQIERGCRIAFSEGYTSVKLYFMMGLPTETLDDIKGIADTAQQVVDLFYKIPNRPKGKGVQVTISVACFVPKPDTPFQFCAQDRRESLREKQKYLLSCVHSRKIKVNYHDSTTSVLEGVFAKGDRRLGRVIETAFENGAFFDTWEEYFNYDRWLDAFKTCGLDPDFYNYRTIGLDEVTPWDHLDVGVTKAHLVREYNKALEAKTTQPCNRQCSACGANKLIGGPCFDYSKNLL